MFIRFKKRMTTSKEWYKRYKEVKTDEIIGTYPSGSPRHKYAKVPIECYTLSVQLVENKRISGKPRQKVIAFLGSVKSEDLTKTPFRLWERAYKVFATHGLDNDTQERLLQQIADKLPRPSVEDIERNRQEGRAFRVYYAMKWRQEGKAIPDGWLEEGDLENVSVVP